jgi:hypothetical protein
MRWQGTKTIQQLEEKIAIDRRRLQELWDARGITDAEVLNASIELDNLLNLYQKYLLKEK